MIESVAPILTPTQYVGLRVVPDAAGWEAQTLRAYAVDGISSRAFERTIEIEADSTAELIKVGPFIKGGVADISVTLLDAEGDTIDAWQDQVQIENNNSPAVIIRQGVYDILEAAAINGVMLLNDGYGRPSSPAEDVPFASAEQAIEVGSPASTKRQVSPVRSDVTCEIPINLFVIGHNISDAFAIADNLAWHIQSLVDAAPNLWMSGLGVNNFTWMWTVQPPDFIDTTGSPVPIIVQELILTVPVIWVSVPNKT